MKKSRNWYKHNVMVWTKKIILAEVDIENRKIGKDKKIQLNLFNVRYFGTFKPPIRYPRFVINRGRWADGAIRKAEA